MQKVILGLLALVASSFGAISSLTIPHEIDSAAIPKVIYIDQNNDSLVNKINEIKDTVNSYTPGSGVFLGTFFKSLTNARVGIDFDANATGNYFWISHNAADSLFRVRDDSTWKAFGAGDVTKITASDTVAAALGFRAGSAGATDAQLYRSGANMWTTPDSLTVAGRLAVTGAATAASIALGGGEAFTAGDTSFTITATGFSGSVTGTAYASRFGNIVVLYIPTLSGTSNSSAFTLTGLPTPLRPARAQFVQISTISNNSAGDYAGGLDIATDGTILVYRRTDASTQLYPTFTASGTKGLAYNTITYSLL